MKIIIYYCLLLIGIVLISIFLISGDNSNSMQMSTMISISALLVIYTVGLSLVGENKSRDEREQTHKYYANRTALIGGTIILCIGVLYQLYHHQLDYWLLASLVGINLTKIASMIYLNYKK